MAVREQTDLAGGLCYVGGGLDRNGTNLDCLVELCRPNMRVALGIWWRGGEAADVRVCSGAAVRLRH